MVFVTWSLSIYESWGTKFWHLSIGEPPAGMTQLVLRERMRALGILPCPINILNGEPVGAWEFRIMVVNPMGVIGEIQVIWLKNEVIRLQQSNAAMGNHGTSPKNDAWFSRRSSDFAIIFSMKFIIFPSFFHEIHHFPIIFCRETVESSHGGVRSPRPWPRSRFGPWPGKEIPRRKRSAWAKTRRGDVSKRIQNQMVKNLMFNLTHIYLPIYISYLSNLI